MSFAAPVTPLIETPPEGMTSRETLRCLYWLGAFFFWGVRIPRERHRTALRLPLAEASTSRQPAGSGIVVTMPPGHQTEMDWGSRGIARTVTGLSCDQYPDPA